MEEKTIKQKERRNNENARKPMANRRIRNFLSLNKDRMTKRQKTKKYRQNERQKDRKTKRQKGKKAERQKGRKTERQKDKKKE